MSPAAIVWTATGVLLVVILVFAAIQAVRALREAKRAMARVRGYKQLPVVRALRDARRDVARLQALSGERAILIARAATAIAAIRRDLHTLRQLGRS